MFLIVFVFMKTRMIGDFNRIGGKLLIKWTFSELKQLKLNKTFYAINLLGLGVLLLRN